MLQRRGYRDLLGLRGPPTRPRGRSRDPRTFRDESREPTTSPMDRLGSDHTVEGTRFVLGGLVIEAALETECPDSGARVGFGDGDTQTSPVPQGLAPGSVSDKTVARAQPRNLVIFEQLCLKMNR